MFQNKPNAEVRSLPHGLIHAVERLSLGLDWDTELGAAAMAHLSSLGDRVSKLLPRKIEISTSGVRSTISGITKDSAEEGSSELFALLFDDNDDHEGAFDDKLIEMVINRTGIRFVVNFRYSGWEVTRNLALDVYKVFYEAISSQVSISSMNFRVSNVFGLKNFVGPLGNLLDVECTSLPRRVFASEGLWHLDEGYFEDHVSPGVKQLLVNLHVSKALEDEDTNLYIHTMHQLEFHEDSSSALSLEELFDKFDELHRINKLLLSSVLADNIVHSLELFPDQEAIA
ncbi:hypothetical protein DV532_24390 [Pseudomonas sp. Leaf58]|uniref:hypothetical protein n=1 Tax=Pseudomonas sp. Leaf58 TaxID=1736226 RepID=UPI0006F580E8|nr:hypothetical protein [Pseudomonas sp. Leaf58]AYG47261.1 hypothetical protein DV532_24390 [Pseudomonas sp. Leaf58]KQN66292.1 hypothetical protein ASF02_01350 [Pseudomonas sp. Leaf58]